MSSTWEYFKFRVAEDDINRSFAHCVLCLESGQKKRGAIKYCGGTYNLTNHLKSWHKTEFKLVTENQVVSKLVQSETILDHLKSKSIVWPKTSEKWKKLTMSLAKWFCKNSRSTAMVEDEGFAAFMALACPSYELPSRKTLSKYIEELYQKDHKRVKSSRRTSSSAQSPLMVARPRTPPLSRFLPLFHTKSSKSSFPSPHDCDCDQRPPPQNHHSHLCHCRTPMFITSIKT